MMIEVLLTCLLLGGIYTPPSGWTLISVITAPPDVGSISYCYSIKDGCERAAADAARGRIPRVQLQRTFKAGEKITLPDSCTMEVKQPPEPPDK